MTVNFPLVRALRSGLKSNSKVFIATQRPRVEAMEESIFLLVGLAEMYVTSVIIVTFMKFGFFKDTNCHCFGLCSETCGNERCHLLRITSAESTSPCVRSIRECTLLTSSLYILAENHCFSLCSQTPRWSYASMRCALHLFKCNQ